MSLIRHRALQPSNASPRPGCTTLHCRLPLLYCDPPSGCQLFPPRLLPLSSTLNFVLTFLSYSHLASSPPSSARLRFRMYRRRFFYARSLLSLFFGTPSSFLYAHPQCLIMHIPDVFQPRASGRAQAGFGLPSLQPRRRSFDYFSRSDHCLLTPESKDCHFLPDKKAAKSSLVRRDAHYYGQGGLSGARASRTPHGTDDAIRYTGLLQRNCLK